MILGWLFGYGKGGKKHEEKKLDDHIAKYAYRLKYVEGRIKLMEDHLEEVKGKLDTCCDKIKGGGGR